MFGNGWKFGQASNEPDNDRPKKPNEQKWKLEEPFKRQDSKTNHRHIERIYDHNEQKYAKDKNATKHKLIVTISSVEQDQKSRGE